MRTILIPTDFSDNAWSATVYALKLYAEEVCTFYFIHATKMKASSMSNISNRLLKAMSEDALKELNDIKDMTEEANANANHTFEIILSSEDLLTAIKSAISTYEIELIVMGTKGITSARDLIFGTNTVDALNTIKSCPLLIIPDEFEYVTPTQIAFPTDFNRFYGNELRPLKQLSELHNSKIRIVHIFKEDELSEVQNYNVAMLKANLEDYPHSFHWMPDYEKKTIEINDFIVELNINILAMINYKHSILEHILHEPVIKKLGYRPQVPFLVIPSQER